MRAKAVLVVIGLVAVPVLAWWYFIDRPARTLDRLLAGDEQVAIAALVFDGRHGPFAVSDPASAAYLSAAFRAATYEGFVPTHDSGYTYYARVQFVTGGSLTICCDAPDDTDGMTVSPDCCRVWDDATRYWVAFPEPMLESVRAVLRKVRAGN